MHAALHAALYVDGSLANEILQCAFACKIARKVV